MQEVNDGLWEAAPNFRVTREHVLPVIHCLVGRRDTPITQALSHPQALAQCRNWLHAHGIVEVVGDDTAGSARWLAENPTQGMAAIASAAAARRYGLEVLAEGIQDDLSNRTRFLVVEPGMPARPAEAAPGSRCSLAFITAHTPGSLVTALRTLSDRGVNLTRLDSRPVIGKPFEYRFYLDFEVAEPAGSEEALSALEAAAGEVRLFGTYPAAIV